MLVFFSLWILRGVVFLLFSVSKRLSQVLANLWLVEEENKSMDHIHWISFTVSWTWWAICLRTFWTVNIFRIFLRDWSDSPKVFQSLDLRVRVWLQVSGSSVRALDEISAFSIHLFRQRTHIHLCPWHVQPFPELNSRYLLEWGRGIIQWLDRGRGSTDLFLRDTFR